jgi:energy-coupling factor transporter ATP-binding protein EcfA2
MSITIKMSHRFDSIASIPEIKIPSFSVITGLNGSGKTHLLRALSDGNSAHIAFDDRNMAINPGIYLDITTLKPVSFPEHFGQINAHGNNIDYSRARNYLPARGILGLQLHPITQLKMQYQNTNPESNIEELSLSQRSVALNIPEDVLRKVEEKFGMITDMTEVELETRFPSQNYVSNPFGVDLNQLFYNYLDNWLGNRSRIHEKNLGKTVQAYTDDEFIVRFGPPPWEVINKSLEVAEIPYFVDTNYALKIVENPYIRIVDTRKNLQVPPDKLSSGEKILFSLSLCQFTYDLENDTKIFPSLILLDEIDAVLHPKMIVKLISIIEQVFIDKMKSNVILVTHSGVTVALAPEKSIYLMDNSLNPCLEPVSQQNAIRALTYGVPTLAIKLENRRHIVVESDQDQLIYEIILDILIKERYFNLDLSFVFISSGTEKHNGTSSHVKSVAKVASEQNSTIFGVVDWDNQNEPENHLFVMGYKNRYTIETFLFDPILLVLSLITLEIDPGIFELPVNFKIKDIEQYDQAKIQQISDNVIAYLEFDSVQEKTECFYVNQFSIQIPKVFLSCCSNHGLHKKIVKAFRDSLRPEKREILCHGKNLTDHILKKIIPYFPGFIPVEFRDLFEQLARKEIS